jgi:hypothetical protein
MSVIGEIDDAIAFINQEANEKRYSRKHIDGYIRDEIEADPAKLAKVEQGTQLLTDWIRGNYYASKNRRLAQLRGLEPRTMVMDIFVGIAYITSEELFTSVTAQMAGRLRFSDKTEAILTIGEIMAVLCQTDAFDINKASKSSSLVIVSNLKFSEKLTDYIMNSQYLPPMVCEPRELRTNFSSGYLSHNDSLILGSGNHHDGDICLDVLNLMNRVPLQLDTEFLSKVEETPNHALETPEQIEHWRNFKKQSYRFYELMVSQGNRFYLTHKVDKRGRGYAQGYHINTQGSSFKKAMIELAEEEYITGVPT